MIGFMKGKSTLDCIHHIIPDAEKNKEEKMLTILIVTDIEQAFDNVKTSIH